jgi:hypothetical protein
VIEAVKRDLWNFVTYGNKDVTIIISEDNIDYIGNNEFLSQDELELLKKYSNIIKRKYRDSISEGKSLILEWSFAYNTDINKVPVGDEYLVFYELRSL